MAKRRTKRDGAKATGGRTGGAGGPGRDAAGSGRARPSAAGDRRGANGGPGRGAAGDAGLSIPLWVPAVLFVALTVVLFRDFIFSDRMLFGGDTLGLGYTARATYAEALKELGAFPRWAPWILGGTPMLEALSSGDALYPPSLLLLLVMEAYRALGWKLVLHIGAAGFLMFGWVRSLGASRPAALLAGTAYLVAPFLVTLVHPGHDGKLFVVSLAPLLFWVVERHFSRPGLVSFSGIGLVVAGILYTTHFQMAYFLFGAVGLYALFRAVQVGLGGGGDGTAPRNAGAQTEDAGARDEGAEAQTEGAEARTEGANAAHSPRRPGAARGGLLFGTFLAASVLGAGGAAVQFWPAVKYVTEYSRRIATTREAAGETSRAWSSSWSLHPEEAMSQLLPEFAGNDAGGSEWTSGTYWGRNPFKDNSEYAGVVMLLLAAASFVGARRRGVRLFFTGLGSLAFLFALGVHTPVWGLFYELVPGIRLFRAPSQVMFLWGFGAITLAALGFDRILQVTRDGDEAAWRTLQRVLWGGAGVLVLLALLASSGTLTSIWTSALYPEADAGRIQALLPHLGRGAWTGAFLALAVAGATWALKRRMLPAAFVVGLVVFFAALDGLRVDRSFIQTLDPARVTRPSPTVQALLDRHRDDPEPYRLYSLVGGRDQDVGPATFGIELVNGHHPNDMARYRELIGMVGSDRARNLADPRIRALLNVRYILWPDWQLGPAPGGTVVSQSQLRDGRTYETLLAEDGLPRARLLARAVVKSDDEAVPYMLSEAFDPAAEVVLAQEPPVALDGQPVQGSVTWEEHTPNRLRLRVSVDRPALLVVADNWFPAWRATVDGAEAPVLRAYHTLRAVPVDAGEHTVEMTYHSAVVARSLWVTVVVLLGLLAALGVGILQERRRGGEAV